MLPGVATSLARLADAIPASSEWADRPKERQAFAMSLGSLLNGSAASRRARDNRPFEVSPAPSAVGVTGLEPVTSAV